MRSIAEPGCDFTLRELKQEDWIAANAFSRQPESGLSIAEVGLVEFPLQRNHPSGHELILPLNVDDWVAAPSSSQQERAFTVVDAGGKFGKLPASRAKRARTKVAAA